MPYDSEQELLFSDHDLSDVLRGHEAKMNSEIDSIDENRLLGTSVGDWLDYFENEYTIEAIELGAEITVDQEEMNVDVSGHPGRDIGFRNRPHYVKGSSVKFHVPFEGDPELLKSRPSSFTLSPPRAAIRGNELVFEYREINPNGKEIRSEFDRTLGEVKMYAGNVEKQVRPFNDAIRDNARRRLEARREKLLANKEMVQNLGFRLRERPDFPKTYIAPHVKRKVTPVRAPTASGQYSPEPALAMDEYENILKHIQGMTMVMERNPQAFASMKEENLRHHFLVPLNLPYDGHATGETFNFNGKTDILIRVENKNIFIAECKFWTGPKGFTETIDQILGYLSWRDTKAAILVFNRNRNMSDVLAKIPGAVEGHANFKRHSEFDHETGFRFAMHQQGDVNREVILTVLVFDVPG